MRDENKQPVTELRGNTIFSTHTVKKHGFSVSLNQTILSLTKFAKKNIKSITSKSYIMKNTFHIVSNEAHLILYILLLSFFTNLVKFSMV